MNSKICGLGRYWIVLCFTLGLMMAGAVQSKAQNNSGKRLLNVDDLFRIKNVSSPKISPDGKWVAYTVSETSLEKNRSTTRIWMKAVGGGDAIAMTLKDSSATNPAWSPDGSYLSFMASRNGGKNQLWILNRKGGEGQQLTHVKQGIQDYAWSADGKKLALTIKDTLKTDGQKDQPQPVVINRLQFKQDYKGYLDTLKTHIYSYDLAKDRLLQLTSGSYDEFDPVWSPDGKYIAFVSNRTSNPDANDNSDIWLVASDNTDKGAKLK